MRFMTRTMTMLGFAMALLILASPPGAQAAGCTWNGSSGNWNEAEKWSCKAVPGQDDDAIISGGTVTLTEDASVASLTQSGGTLTGPGRLTAGTINWSGGTMSGSGSTTATSSLSFTGSADINLLERTFNNAGAATWNKTGYLYLNPSVTVFNNQAGAAFTIESSGPDVVYGDGTFNNAGAFTKTSPGTTANSIQFNNSGALSVESGMLVLNNNALASTSSGGYNVLSGAVLRLNGLYAPISLNGNIAGTGTGTIEIAGRVNVSGTLTFSGAISITGINYGRLNLTTDATTADIGILNMADGNGTLMGPGRLTAGTINWSGGTMSGSGSTTATSALNLTGFADISLLDRTLNNAGAATWNRTGSLYLNPAAANFNNQAGATFTVQSSGPTLAHGEGTFKNSGTLNLTTGKIDVTTFKQEAGGITNLAIRGVTPVTDYCQLKARDLVLTGPLNISFTGGYTPHVRDHFVLLSYGATRTGDYSPVNITPLEDGFWLMYYQNKSLVLWAMKYHAYLPITVGQLEG